MAKYANAKTVITVLYWNLSICALFHKFSLCLCVFFLNLSFLCSYAFSLLLHHIAISTAVSDVRRKQQQQKYILRVHVTTNTIDQMNKQTTPTKYIISLSNGSFSFKSIICTYIKKNHAKNHIQR